VGVRSVGVCVVVCVCDVSVCAQVVLADARFNIT
jgi:hypothetical protein